VADRDIKDGERIVRRILNDLEKGDDLPHRYAEATLQKARQNAASRPTPQAPMAASTMSVSGVEIRATAGGAPSAVAFGSEFGSDIFLQFHKPHNPRGYWLMPAAESPDVEKAGDSAIEDIMQGIIRGF
jgi:hypothetical protein